MAGEQRTIASCRSAVVMPEPTRRPRRVESSEKSCPPRRLSGAARAVAANDDLVAMHAETEAPREPVQRALEVAVVERHEAPAGVAEQVVMMHAGGINGLIAGYRVAQVQTADQASLLQQVEDPVDARASDTALALAQQVFDLERRQRALLRREKFDDRGARSATPVPRLVEYRPGVLRPLRPMDCGHAGKLSDVTAQVRLLLDIGSFGS